MSSPLYAVVTALHVLAAVAGFGAIGVTGVYAHAVRVTRGPAAPGLLRFFRPGRNWAARAIFLVPLLGGVLLVLGHGQDAGKLFPWLGLAIWTVAAGISSSLLWPAEREVQQRLASGGGEGLDRAAARCERAAAATTLLFVAALVVMIAQPS